MQILKSINRTKIELNLYESVVKAGFPSPAEDFIDKKLDLNEHLIKHPAATFFVKVEGDSMENAGITSGDLLIVDRFLEPKNGAIVLAVIDNEFTVKRVKKLGQKLFLMPENPKYQPIEINESQNFLVWGVVTYAVKGLG